MHRRQERSSRRSRTGCFFCAVLDATFGSSWALRFDASSSPATEPRSLLFDNVATLGNARALTLHAIFWGTAHRSRTRNVWSPREGSLRAWVSAASVLQTKWPLTIGALASRVRGRGVEAPDRRHRARRT